MEELMSRISLAASVAAAALLAWPVSAQDQAARIDVAEKEPFGEYLVDGEGMSLYLLEEDTQGAAGSAAVSTCSEACAEAWPPLVTTGDAQAGERIDAAMLSTIERDDGSMQVTYNGWPLYHYAQDQQAGDTTGHDVHDDWGEWYLVAPSGEHVEEEGE
jgi:predicted lipoprotein with Yx(FWY)xxD motif